MDCCIDGSIDGPAAIDETGAGKSRPGSCVRRSVLPLATAFVTAVACCGAARPEPVKLGVLSIAEARAAGVGGTGCYWSDRTGGTLRMAMADDRAVVKIDGALLRLRKDADAADLFPFTYDSWIAEGLRIQIVEEGRRRRTGTEVGSVSARLVVKSSWRTTIMRGTMACGT